MKTIARTHNWGFMVTQILLTAFLALALSGTAFANKNKLAGMYEGSVLLHDGSESITIRLSKDGQLMITSVTELPKETPGIGEWKYVGKDGENRIIHGVAEYYMEIPGLCDVDSANGEWGCQFHASLDAVVSPDGKMTGDLSIAFSDADTPNQIRFVISLPVEAQYISFEDRYNRGKGTPVPNY